MRWLLLAACSAVLAGCAVAESLVRQQLGASSRAHWLAALRGKDIAEFDPTTPIDPTGLGTLWYVQAAYAPTAGALPDRLVTLIFIDATRELRWRSDGQPPLARGPFVGPLPRPGEAQAELAPLGGIGR